MRIQKPILFIILAAISTACTPKPLETPYTTVLSRTETMEKGNFWDLIWPSNQSLQVVMEIDDQIYKYDIGNENLAPMGLEKDPACKRNTDYIHPEVLPDGRIGFIKICKGQIPELMPWEGGDFRYLIAFDPISGSIENIVNQPLPHSFSSNTYTWNPDLTIGLQARSGIKSTIYWISKEKAYPLDITLVDGNRIWSLLDSWDYKTTLDNDELGLANRPDWSPDGKSIVFVANMDAIGKSGLVRNKLEHKLYLMDPEELDPIPILDGIYYPQTIRWSPDSEWIVIQSHMGNAIYIGEGLWVFSPNTNNLVKVAEGNFAHAEWSPDSQSLAAVFCFDNLCEQAEVRVYDLTELITSQ